MKRTKQSSDFKADEVPDLKKVICPLVWETSKIAITGSYDLSPMTTTKFVDGEDKPLDGFVIKSKPLATRDIGGRIIPPGAQYYVRPNGRRDEYFMETTPGYEKETFEPKGKNTNTRGHAVAFYKALSELKVKGSVPSTWNAYYFTYEEGVAARAEFISAALAGKTTDGLPFVVNKRSWTNMFAEDAGSSYEELVEKFPHLYGDKKADDTAEKVEQRGVEAARAQRKQQPEQEEPAEIRKEESPDEEKTTLDEDYEPSEEEIAAAAEEEADAIRAAENGEEGDLLEDILEEGEQPEEDILRDAAVRVTRANQGAVVIKDQPTTKLFLSGYMDPWRLAEDNFVRAIETPSGEGLRTVRFYEVCLPESDLTMFVQPGIYEINGRRYEFAEKDPQDPAKVKSDGATETVVKQTLK